MPADLDHRPTVDPTLHDKLHRWVAASLITPEEADAIETFEGSVARAAPAEPRRVPLLTEALIYVGAALTAAAAVMLLGDRWEDVTPAIRCAAVGTACLAALAAGALLRRSPDPAMGRVTSLAWLVATGLFGWLAWLVAYDVLDLRGRVPALAAGMAMTVLGAGLYVLLRRALQQMAMVGGLLTVVGVSVGEGSGAMVAVWAVAVVWIIVGNLGLLPPDRAALVGGSVVAIWAPIGFAPVGIWLGLATGIGLVVAGVARHASILVGFGAFGIFVYLLRVLAYHFGDTAAMPVALLVSGAALLTLAIAYARRSGRRPTRTARRSPS